MQTITKHCYRGKGYVARVKGTDARYGLRRDFLRKRDVTAHRTNTYRDLEWVITGDGIYEVDHQATSGQHERTYLAVDGDTAIEVDYADALARVTAEAAA